MDAEETTSRRAAPVRGRAEGIVKVNIVDLRPADTPEYMTGIWVACIHWAIGEPEIVAAFRQETGMHWTPGHSGLERMIDEATGADRHFIEAFIRWVNVEIWGPIDGGEPADDLTGGRVT